MFLVIFSQLDKQWEREQEKGDRFGRWHSRQGSGCAAGSCRAESNLAGTSTKGGAVQLRQLHVMLAGGMRLLQRWFPETVSQMRVDCPRVDWGADSLWISPVGEMPRREVGVVTHTCTRGYMEGLMAEEMACLDIEWVSERAKERFIWRATGSRRFELLGSVLRRISWLIRWVALARFRAGWQHQD